MKRFFRWAGVALALLAGAVQAQSTSDLISGLAGRLAGASGASYVTYNSGATGAVSRGVNSRLQDTVSAFDFMTGAQAANVKSGAATIDVTAALQACINAVGALTRGGTCYLPPGEYLISSTLNITKPYVRLQGAGRFATLLVATTDFNDIVVGTNPITGLQGNDVIDLGFYYAGASPKTTSSLTMISPLQSTVRVAVQNGKNGIVLYGGQGITLDQIYAPGNYDPGTSALLNSGQGITLAAASTLGGYTMGTGAVDLPTEVNFHDIYLNGPRMKGWQYGVAIFAGEHLTFSGDYYIGQSTINNVHIEQDANNKLILETKLERGGYIDAAGQAAIYVGGPNGNGSQYIGSMTIDADVKGQGGDGQTGITIDGTSRGGSFPQAVRNVKIGANVSGFAKDGIVAAGGVNLSFNAKVWGNSVLTPNQGSGLVIGPSVTGAQVTGQYGGGTYGDGTGNQTYGISIDGASRYVSVLNADLRGNQSPTNGVTNAGTSHNRIENCPGFSGNRPVVTPAWPATGVDIVNPYGSKAQVLIFGGTVTSIKLNGQQMFNTTVNAPITVEPDGVLNITYTGTPGWIWWPQ
ncbi:hypothetical protein G3O06_26935 [Burkholderia sp. Ac-20345]|uniref:glycosyl hydrolase family 28-related protein n=1 Tax=Burkholderia sp. Ac-20345 TaxID=2703891 RepID=UPI00197B6FC2|nr:glycosyl hydrolase family 28-related protein [Burkholderia sp. Ac-20345]MBN3781152.1 hypothetical protein [Burkholderia sp. Ac-20345]